MATNRRKTKQNTPHRASGSRPGTDVRRNTAAPRHKRPDKVRQPVLNEPDKTKTGAPDIGTIQWFPGHMARTRRKIQESLSMVDAVVEIVDALLAGFETYPAATLDVIFGRYNPTGKLPITLPKGDEVLAVNENGKAYAYRDANGNYYELNFGLSY